MQEFTFHLKYALSKDDRDGDDLVERLGAAGCTDALVGSGIVGRLGLEFTREAESALAAFLSALQDVRKAMPTAHLVEAGPDLVGLTDVADIIGVSRQAVRKLWLANADFPQPTHEGSAKLWHLVDVLVWLDARRAYAIAPELVEVARVALQVNLAKEAKRYVPQKQAELQRAFA